MVKVGSITYPLFIWEEHEIQRYQVTFLRPYNNRDVHWMQTHVCLEDSKYRLISTMSELLRVPNKIIIYITFPLKFWKIKITRLSWNVQLKIIKPVVYLVYVAKSMQLVFTKCQRRSWLSLFNKSTPSGKLDTSIKKVGQIAYAFHFKFCKPKLQPVEFFISLWATWVCQIHSQSRSDLSCSQR